MNWSLPVQCSHVTVFCGNSYYMGEAEEPLISKGRNDVKNKSRGLFRLPRVQPACHVFVMEAVTTSHIQIIYI